MEEETNFSSNNTVNYTNLNDSVTTVITLGDQHVDYYGPVPTAFFGVWLTLIIVLSVMGNLLVILSVIFVKELRKLGTNIFIVNLAVSDIMVGIFMAPISLYTLLHEEWNFGEFMCTLNLFFNTTFLFTSVHTLMYISIHKYMSVKRLADCDVEPVSRSVCLLFLAASWLWGVAFGLITCLGLGQAEYKKKTTQCGPRYPIFTVKSVSLSLTNFALNFCIPFIIMAVMYYKIYKIMQGTTRFRRQSTRRNSELERHSSQNAAINTMKIVLFFFILCWVPYLVYTNYVFFKSDRETIPPFLNPLAYCFGFTGSACNPIIYALRFPDFRDGYSKIISKMFCRTNRGSLTIENQKEKMDLVKRDHTVC